MAEAVETRPGRDRRTTGSLDLALYAVLVVLTFAAWGPLVRVGLNLGDEGWLVTAIDRLVAGERLYADVYRSYAPGLYWFFAALSRFFDADLVTIRWVWLAAHALIGVTTYRLARQVSPAGTAFVAALAVLLLRAPVHKTFVPLCYVGSLWLCHRLVARPVSARTLLAIGVGFGAVGLLRQEAAAFGILIGLGSLFIMRQGPDRTDPAWPRFATDTAWVAAGIGLVWLPVGAFLLFEGSLTSAVEQLVLAGARGNAAMDLPFPDLGRIFVGPGHVQASLFFMPAFATALGAILTWRAWRRAPRSNEAIVVGQWTAMALFAHSIFASRTDLPHLLQALVAPMLVLAYAMGLAWNNRTTRPNWPSRVLGLAIALWMTLAVVTLNDLPRQYALRRDGRVLEVPGSEVIVAPRRAETLTRLVAAIEASTDPNESIFVAPYAPGIYHLAGRRNPTRHDAILPGYASASIQAELIEALDRNRPPLVVIDRTVWDGRPDRALRAFAPELTRYLSDHYAVRETIGRFSLMARR